MKHFDLIQASTDGAITPEEWRAARSLDARDAAAADRRAGCRVKPQSVRWKPAGAVWRMARDLVTLRSAKGFALQTDLYARGWSKQDVAALGADAVTLAAQLWTKRLMRDAGRRVAA